MLAELLSVAVVGRLALALGLGAAVGLERELSGKPAGLRTNMLICVGAALFTELSLVASTMESGPDIMADPGRIAAQIVSGIGFIGAGTIMVMRGSVVGLTTAATLWVVAAIGMAVGLQFYWEAVAATILVILTLYALGKVAEAVLVERTTGVLRVGLMDPTRPAEDVESLLTDVGLEITHLGHRRDKEGVSFTFRVSGARRDRERLLSRLAEREDVREVQLE